MIDKSLNRIIRIERMRILKSKNIKPHAHEQIFCDKFFYNKWFESVGWWTNVFLCVPAMTFGQRNNKHSRRESREVAQSKRKQLWKDKWLVFQVSAS